MFLARLTDHLYGPRDVIDNFFRTFHPEMKSEAQGGKLTSGDFFCSRMRMVCYAAYMQVRATTVAGLRGGRKGNGLRVMGGASIGNVAAESLIALVARAAADSNPDEE